MHLILLMFFAHFTDAKVIEVKYRNLSYKISYTDDVVTYTNITTELSLKKAACNQHIIRAFNKKMDLAMNGMHSSVPSEDFFALKIDKELRYDSLESRNAEFFGGFDQHFRALKVEEMLSCKK